MRPIPRSLLIHSAKLYEARENSWQEQELVELAELTHIRVEPASKMIITSDNRSVTLSATLFYDCRNSARVVEFKPGYIVEFGGKRYRVETVEVFYDRQKLHHLDNLSAGARGLQLVRSGRPGRACQQLEYPQRYTARKARLVYSLR